MNIQPCNNIKSSGEIGKSEVLNPTIVPSLIFFTEEEYPQGIEFTESDIDLFTGLGISQTLEIDPDEFESIYKWFFS